MTKQETNAVKQFLSKTDDIYRAAYGRRTNKYPRRCVFFGTSNEEDETSRCIGTFPKRASGGDRD